MMLNGHDGGGPWGELQKRLRAGGGPPRQRGFSLLEVVVAFAILALSMGVLLQIFSTAINTTTLSGTYSRAATLAEARLNAIGLEIPLEPGTQTGEPEDGLQWQVFIDYYDLGEVSWEAPLQPYLVTSVVSWDTARGTRQISLTSLRLGEIP